MAVSSTLLLPVKTENFLRVTPNTYTLSCYAQNKKTKICYFLPMKIVSNKIKRHFDKQKCSLRSV
ncbi:hypothetical protein DERP_015152 [Dermatophagoides pteronyssinus]|uniref:Uncharacterized protein n=1 Tax=Dermatophagoides pteronyssinus TaxID=6956 RepID=A0ABQ8JTT1_DERPT|nr:hypothetical protein DERP_015152 [Dermatophagoides pteronyssinus]